MLDDDDDFDDDDSVGVSVGDGEFAGDDGVAPHGKSGFFGTVAATCVFGDSGCGKCGFFGTAGSGRSRFFVCFVVVVLLLLLLFRRRCCRYRRSTTVVIGSCSVRWFCQDH